MADETVSSGDSSKQRLIFRNIGIGLFIYLFLKFCGVFQFYGPYWGRVVDADTGQPIEGAGVLTKYVRYFPVLSGPATEGIQEAFTDESGYFFLWPRLVLDAPIPLYVFQWAPELTVIKERYHVAGTEFLGSEDETLFTMYGDYKRTPTSFGPMVIQLRKLKPDKKEYRKYSSDLSSSVDTGPTGIGGIILGFLQSERNLQFVQLAVRESVWGYEQSEKIEAQERQKKKK